MFFCDYFNSLITTHVVWLNKTSFFLICSFNGSDDDDCLTIVITNGDY